MLRDFYLGLIKIHIIYHASKEPIFGVSLMKELARHGYNTGPGTLYPIWHSLETQGLLTSSRQVANGRMRRYYQITPKGQQSLAEARCKIRELVNEIIEEKP